MSWIKLRRFFVAFLLVFLSTSVAFALFETFLHIETRSEAYPRVSLDINGVGYSFEESTAKALSVTEAASSKSNIFVVGDSFVAGATCAAKSEHLTGHMANLMPSSNIVNLGVGGKNPANYIDFLNYLTLKRGDTVVVVLYDNDIHVSDETCALSLQQKQHFDIHVPDFCQRQLAGEQIAKDKTGFFKKINQSITHFATVQLVKESLHNLPYFSALFYRSEYVSRWNDFNAEENKWIRSTIPVMQKIAESKGAKFELTYYPNSNSIIESDPRHQVWKNFSSKVDRELAIKLHDPYPYFLANAPRKAMVWSLTDKHPSCDAHKLMAEYVVSTLR
jgi:hypothetical protein